MNEEKIEKVESGFNPLQIFPSGFVADYFKYAEPLTDAPMQFHIPAALCTLSTVVGRNVFLQLGDKRLYPNFWCLVLGKSSVPRKTTSIQPGLNLLYELNHNLVLPNDFSIEALLEHLSHQPQGILAFSEFSVLLEMCQRSYMAGLKGLLTDLYDCRPRFTRKLKSGEYTIENGFLSLIGASTIDWLINGLREGDIRGGFMARFLYFVASKKTKSIPIPPKPDLELRTNLIEELRAVSVIQGEMKYSPEAEECYKTWYLEHEKGLGWELQSDLLSSFFSRLPDYCWKIAMLYSISVERELTISGGAVCKAIALTEYVKGGIKHLIEEEFEFSEEGRNKKKVFRFISHYFETRKTPIDHSTLLRNSHLPAKKLREATEALVAEGKLLPPNGDGRYWLAELAEIRRGDANG